MVLLLLSLTVVLQGRLGGRDQVVCWVLTHSSSTLPPLSLSLVCRGWREEGKASAATPAGEDLSCSLSNCSKHNTHKPVQLLRQYISISKYLTILHTQILGSPLGLGQIHYFHVWINVVVMQNSVKQNIGSVILVLSYPCCGVSECILLLRESVPSSEEVEESRIKPPSSGRPGNRNLWQIFITLEKQQLCQENQLIYSGLWEL